MRKRMGRFGGTFEIFVFCATAMRVLQVMDELRAAGFPESAIQAEAKKTSGS
jgi:uncharacterized membrane protein